MKQIIQIGTGLTLIASLSACGKSVEEELKSAFESYSKNTFITEEVYAEEISPTRPDEKLYAFNIYGNFAEDTCTVKHKHGSDFALVQREVGAVIDFEGRYSKIGDQSSSFKSLTSIRPDEHNPNQSYRLSLTRKPTGETVYEALTDIESCSELKSDFATVLDQHTKKADWIAYRDSLVGKIEEARDKANRDEGITFPETPQVPEELTQKLEEAKKQLSSLKASVSAEKQAYEARVKKADEEYEAKKRWYDQRIKSASDYRVKNKLRDEKRALYHANREQEKALPKEHRATMNAIYEQIELQKSNVREAQEELDDEMAPELELYEEEMDVARAKRRKLNERVESLSKLHEWVAYRIRRSH